MKLHHPLSTSLAAATLALLLTVACSGSDTPEPDTTTSAPATGDDPDRRVADYLDELGTTGFSGVVLVDDGKSVTAEGFGLADRETNTRWTPDTVFDVGSITKQFTGAAILRMELDGLVSVSDTIGEHLDNVPGQYQSVTLHQLLTHTAGVPESLGRDYDPVTLDDFLGLLSAAPPSAAPGTTHAYSNVGYSLLAAVIEQVSGQPLERYMRDNLFLPAGMELTGYVLPNWDEASVAIGYPPEGYTDVGGDYVLGRPNEQSWAVDGPYWHLRGNGGLLSTAQDMYRWHQALLTNDILDEPAKAKFYGRHTPEGEGADTFYGYGWALFPTPFDSDLVVHDGSNGIFFANFLRYLDEDVTIFMATNAVRPQDEPVAFELAGRVFDLDLAEAAPVCAFDRADLDSLDALDDFPAGETGQIAREFVSMLLESEQTISSQFVETRLTAQVRQGLPTETVIELLNGLRTEFDGLTFGTVYMSGPTAVHTTLTDADNVAVVITVVTDETEPSTITCVDFNAPDE